MDRNKTVIIVSGVVLRRCFGLQKKTLERFPTNRFPPLVKIVFGDCKSSIILYYKTRAGKATKILKISIM